jgi:outer membrane protein insertion porin family
LAQEAAPVNKIVIEHVGPPAASEDLIKANIRVKPGDPYNRNNIDDDIRTLYSTGYFKDIKVGEERVADGSQDGVTLKYVLTGKPVLTDIQFKGNKKYSRNKLLKKVTSKTGSPIDERKLFSDTQEILKLYQKAGYQKTEVKYVESTDAIAGRGTVTFEIVESPKVKIERVDFVGHSAIKEKKLRKVIKTRKRWMFSWLTGSGVLKDEQFEDDREKLVAYYNNLGYIDFEIKDVHFDMVNPKWMDIRFIISEGRQYKVGSVEFKGNTLFATDLILKGHEKGKGPKMLAGKTFTPKGLTDDIEAIRDFYGAKGYIDVRVMPKKVPNTEQGTMDLVYEIEEKGQSQIEKIEIRGNVHTKDKVIRRELSVAPGEVFDMVKVKRSKSRLEQMNYFEKVETQPEPSDAGSDKKNLVVGVEEKNTGNLLVGAGFSTIDDVVGFAEVNQGNFDLFKPPWFRGGGQKFRFRVQIGTRRQDYLITFIEPWFLGRKLEFSVDLYHQELNYYSKDELYDVRRTGARLGLKKALGSDFLIGGVSYTIENLGIINVVDTAPKSIQDEKGYNLVSKIGTSLAYDTRNHATLPNRGQRTEFLTELAGGPFGGDRDFYKLELRSSWYFKGFSEGHVLQLTGMAGVVDNYGEDTRIPLFDRWFLGGMWSLRGFRYHYAGAENTFDTGEPIGGRSYWFGSAEYSVPVIERVRFALFYDIGNVFRDAYEFKMADYLDNWGLGLRLNLPIGALRFDYGIPISTGASTGKSGRFNFGVGFDRPF